MAQDSPNIVSRERSIRMGKIYAGSGISTYYKLLTGKPILVVEYIRQAKCIGQIGMPDNLKVKVQAYL